MIKEKTSKCGFCNLPENTHKRCKNCTKLIHDMSVVKKEDRVKYECSCHTNHTKQSKEKPEFCEECEDVDLLKTF